MKIEKNIVESYSGEISIVEILAKVILETDIVKNYIVNADFEKYRQQVESENATALCFDEYADRLNAQCVCYGSEKDSAQQAAKLFHSLRQLDEINAGKVYAMMPSTEDVGLAVYNRLLRAAAFRVVNL